MAFLVALYFTQSVYISELMFRSKELCGHCGSWRSLRYRFCAASFLYRKGRNEPQRSQSENSKQVL
jgi:hypothetical protein